MVTARPLSNTSSFSTTSLALVDDNDRRPAPFHSLHGSASTSYLTRNMPMAEQDMANNNGLNRLERRLGFSYSLNESVSSPVIDDKQHSAEKRRHHKGSPATRFPKIVIHGHVRCLSLTLFEMTHLREINCSGNQIRLLPDQISHLVNLETCNASNNEIEYIPATIGLLHNLKTLLLSRNHLTTLPVQLGFCFRLKRLSLEGNPLNSELRDLLSDRNGGQRVLEKLLSECEFPLYNALSPREYHRIHGPTNKSNPVYYIMCYNVLCQQYCTRTQYPYCPQWAMGWDYRSGLIIQQLLNFATHPVPPVNETLRQCFDVICLQEVETGQFEGTFLAKLKDYGYDGLFSPKSRARTMTEQERSRVDGCAIFFNTAKFELVDKHVMEFSQMAIAGAQGSDPMLNRVMTKDNIGLALLLRCRLDPAHQPARHPVRHHYVIVYTAHVHWDPEFRDVKLVQTIMFMTDLARLVDRWTADYAPVADHAPNGSNGSKGSIPLILCGDLNSLPESGPVEYLTRGRVSTQHADFMSHKYDSCLQKLNAYSPDHPDVYRHNFELAQAYDKNQLIYTNFTPDFKGIIDYIFFSRDSFNAVGCLGRYDWDFFGHHHIPGLPNNLLPSDHIPLVVTLELLVNDRPAGHQRAQTEPGGGGDDEFSLPGYGGGVGGGGGGGGGGSGGVGTRQSSGSPGQMMGIHALGQCGAGQPDLQQSHQQRFGYSLGGGAGAGPIGGGVFSPQRNLVGRPAGSTGQFAGRPPATQSPTGYGPPGRRAPAPGQAGARPSFASIQQQHTSAVGGPSSAAAAAAAAAAASSSSSVAAAAGWSNDGGSGRSNSGGGSVSFR